MVCHCVPCWRDPAFFQRTQYDQIKRCSACVSLCSAHELKSYKPAFGFECSHNIFSPVSCFQPGKNRNTRHSCAETRRKNPRFTRYPGTALARVTYVQLQDSGAGTLDPFSSCLFRQGDASSPNLAGCARQLRRIPHRALFKASRGSGEQLQSKPENLPRTSRAGMAEPAQVPLSRLVVPMLLALGWIVGCALMVYIVFS
ncbi:sarcoplasmic/endoplasmic reticulum calcium ATPase regulator DWORF [Patagioenas fasciata]|uniref:sarcoplasmic/endoplasmic reticulum calcium ATPase regulator DWORF n=1 Tax=Patagioenas fasciata TaxID=372321 RepID=UPI003A997EC9